MSRDSFEKEGDEMLSDIEIGLFALIVGGWMLCIVYTRARLGWGHFRTFKVLYGSFVVFLAVGLLRRLVGDGTGIAGFHAQLAYHYIELFLTVAPLFVGVCAAAALPLEYRFWRPNPPEQRPT